MNLLPVAAALERMLAAVRPITVAETVELVEADGRVLAEDLVAPRAQPPFPASAMDGYAVRAADTPGSLRLVGTSAAGASFDGRLEPGECCRIFTGGVVPDGADAILIQENAVADGDTVRTGEVIEQGRYVRPRGLDYGECEVLLEGGTVLSPAALALVASTGAARIAVRRRPRIAIAMTGDELVSPGGSLVDGQIFASNGTGLAATVRRAGGAPIDLGIVPDDLGVLRTTLGGTDADIVVTLGGASVGDHDLVLPALEAIGVRMAFMKLAMRPGKPVMFGTKGAQLFLGLPGNPVSSLVGAEVLLVPLIRTMLGTVAHDRRTNAKLAVDLPPNGDREHYMRARMTDKGVEPFANQDSSLLATLARADVLLVRPRGDGPRKAGESVAIIPL